MIRPGPFTERTTPPSSSMIRPPKLMAAEPCSRPRRNTALLALPPPMSTLVTVVKRWREWLAAPEPRPAIMPSTLGPATVTTKSPARPAMALSTASAFFLRAVSPVMITAPVSTWDSWIPARRYSARSRAVSAAVSMVSASTRGVKTISLVCRTARPAMSMRGIWPARATSTRVSSLNTSWVVVVPMSMPTLIIRREVGMRFSPSGR